LIELSWLRHLQTTASKTNDITDANTVFIHSGEREVFSETARME
jgi:hypothetical protein